MLATIGTMVGGALAVVAQGAASTVMHKVKKAWKIAEAECALLLDIILLFVYHPLVGGIVLAVICFLGYVLSQNKNQEQTNNEETENNKKSFWIKVAILLVVMLFLSPKVFGVFLASVLTFNVLFNLNLQFS